MPPATPLALRVFFGISAKAIPAWAGFWFGGRRARLPAEKENPRTGIPIRESTGKKCLFAEIELLKEALVAVARRAFEVIQQSAAPGHHHEQTAARSVVFGMGLKVIGQHLDALRKKGHLHVCAASVFVVHFDALKFVRRCHISFF